MIPKNKKMIKRFFLLLIMSCLLLPTFGQVKTLLTDFKFIVNDTQEFPNFFEDETLTKTIFYESKNLLQQVLKVDSIEAYQAKEIEYRFLPPYRENIKYIERKSHDFYVSLITSAGVNTTSEGEKTYIIYARVKVETPTDTIFINRSKVVFTLTYDKSQLYNEAVITKTDFKKLYLDLLKNTFTNDSSSLSMQFNKPAILAYNGFINKAEKVVVQQAKSLTKEQFTITSDSTFNKFLTIKSMPMSIAGTIRIQDLADILKFNKEFVVKNKTNRERLIIKGNYEEAIDYETKVRYIKSTKLKVKNKSEKYNLEFFPDKETSWVYTLKWSINEEKQYELLANRYTNFVEIFSNGGLIAIIQLPSSGFKLQQVEQKEFVFFYKSNLAKATTDEVNYLFAFFVIANQFMAEVSEIRSGN